MALGVTLLLLRERETADQPSAESSDAIDAEVEDRVHV
jgi:hypothetical protein